MKIKTILAIALGTLAMTTATLAANDIKVTLNGLNVKFSDAQPVIVNGRTMVPVRGLFEKMGYSIAWNPTTRVATLKGEDNTIACSQQKLTSTDAKTQQTVTVKSDVLPQLINNRFYLPLRSVANIADCSVNWDAKTKTVIIEYNTVENSVSSSSAVTTPTTTKTTDGSTYNNKTEEERIEDQIAYDNPEGDINMGADEYFKSLIPALQSLKAANIKNDNTAFLRFYSMKYKTDEEIKGTVTNYAQTYGVCEKITALTAPSGLGGVDTAVKEYVKLVNQCAQVSIDSAKGTITPAETAAKLKELASARETLSYTFSDQLYQYFVDNNVLWESVYGETALDAMN